MNVTKLDKQDFSKPLVNKVAQSGLITINLEQFIPQEILALDVKDFLFMELILKEKEFRQQLKEKDWQDYANKTVAVFCSTDALVQQWAYMLIVKELLPFTNNIYFGTVNDVEKQVVTEQINALNQEDYNDAKVIVKGCGKKEITDQAYLEITKKLLPVVKTLMFGEACSTVPIFKKK